MVTLSPPMKREAVAPMRTAVLASADVSFRQRVRETLAGLHWTIREAGGGAEALAYLDSAPAEVVILDSWLPDLEVQEFIEDFGRLYPATDLVTVDGTNTEKTPRSPRRNEILFALRQAQDEDGAIWNGAPVIEWRDCAGCRAARKPRFNKRTHVPRPIVQTAGVYREPSGNAGSKPPYPPGCATQHTGAGAGADWNRQGNGGEGPAPVKRALITSVCRVELRRNS